MGDFMRITLAAAILALAATPVMAADWINFHDPQGAFTVSFPANPGVAKNPLPADKGGAPTPGFTYQTIERADVFYVSVYDFSGQSTGDPGKMAATAIRGASRNLGLTDAGHSITLDGHSGLELQGPMKTGQQLIDRTFVVNHRLYQVLVVVPKTPNQSDSADRARFLASFHFVK